LDALLQCVLRFLEQLSLLPRFREAKTLIQDAQLPRHALDDSCNPMLGTIAGKVVGARR
jgi:hypothetical protein